MSIRSLSISVSLSDTTSDLPAAAKLYRRDGLAPADAQKAPMSAGCVSKLRSPSGSMIQGCLLRIHRCTVGRSHDVSSSVPARTVRTGAPGLGVPLIHEPQSGQSQRIVTRPLSVVRSTGRGSAAVIRNDLSAITIPIEKALLVIR
jgi:hypothetical protein